MNEVFRNEIENLAQFQHRTRWKDEPISTVGIPDNQALKIRYDGFFENLLGDTVIYDLSPDVRHKLAAIRDEFYREYRSILSHPLPDHSLHVTLHDLSTAPLDQLEEIKTKMAAHRMQVEKLLQQFRLRYPKPIRLRPTKLVSLVGSSIVLLFEPATDEDCKALTDMYQRLDAVVPLPYPLTPHVTLAYYRPQANGGVYDEALQKTFRHLIQSFDHILSIHKVGEIALDMNDLHYRCFTCMACYMGYNEFLNRTKCTHEELRVRLDFDNLYRYAYNQIACGVLFWDVLCMMAGWDLNLSHAQQEKRCSAARYDLILTDAYSMDESDYHSPSCTGRVGGTFYHQYLCAVILMNLCEQGLLPKTVEAHGAYMVDAEKQGKCGLIRHCLFDLHWNQ